MAYRAAGITNMPRTAAEQFHWGPAVPVNAVSPGDLVFFAGADGTVTNPGHVGMVIGNGKMIEAYATGFPIRVSSYQNQGAIGFTRPAANAKVSSAAPPSGGIPTPGVTPSGTPTSRRGR